MAKKMTKAEVYARAEAYTSAANHLNLGWTEDADEVLEGRKLSEVFYQKAAALFNQADLMTD